MHETPIFGFNDAKEGIVREVTRRVLEDTRDVKLTLNEAAFHEVRRLARHGGAEYADWRSLAGHLGRMSPEEMQAKLRELTEHYAWDVAGNFNPSVYRFASQAMAPILGALLSPRAAARNLPRMASTILDDLRHRGEASHHHVSASLLSLDDRILVQGPTEEIARLAEIGTLVFVPTHLSNLDSVVFGFALERTGLPPATYGAGKNLFTNPVLSYFMHNLGAYRVDRRLKHALYKHVLKAYSALLIERGYHSLFFPGGTRSRSGGVERRLKLGLAGTGIEAYGRSVESGKTHPVFFVPATINYLLTLEAETLIDDFLQEEGKARYIIDDDESTRIGRIVAFAQKLMGLDASVVIRFSRPLDCFGNEVDGDGVSHDGRGRPVDPVGYLVGNDGEAHRDPARDAQYTRELGEAICAAYRRDTVAMPTHVVAAVAFEHLRGVVGSGDLFAILAQRDAVRMPRTELIAGVERLLDRARVMEGRGEIVLAPSLGAARPDAVVAAALRAFAGYHTSSVLVAGATDIILEDTRLLFYYQNRLAAHGLAFDAIKPRGRAAA